MRRESFANGRRGSSGDARREFWRCGLGFYRFRAAGNRLIEKQGGWQNTMIVNRAAISSRKRSGEPAAWKRWIFREKRVTTWRFRLLVFATAMAFLAASYPTWLVAIGNSLLHKQDLEPADVILLENFGTDFSVFAAAQGLVDAGYSSRVVIPVRAKGETAMRGMVQKGFVDVMSRVAGIKQWEVLPVEHVEPVSLNVARQIAVFLESEGVRSVLVVSPGFRSARSYLVYDSVFTPRGIRVQCLAASDAASDNWWHSWHGVQDTGLEFTKFLYYRFWVLGSWRAQPGQQVGSGTG